MIYKNYDTSSQNCWSFNKFKKSGPFGLYINSIFYNVSKCMEYKQCLTSGFHREVFCHVMFYSCVIFVLFILFYFCTIYFSLSQKCFKMPKEKTETVNRDRTVNTITKRKSNDLQSIRVHSRFLVGLVLLDLQFSVQCFVVYCLPFCAFSFDHCVVCPSQCDSPIYYSFGIYKFFSLMTNLFCRPLFVLLYFFFGHCFVCSSSLTDSDYFFLSSLFLSYNALLL